CATNVRGPFALEARSRADASSPNRRRISYLFPGTVRSSEFGGHTRAIAVRHERFHVRSYCLFFFRLQVDSSRIGLRVGSTHRGLAEEYFAPPKDFSQMTQNRDRILRKNSLQLRVTRRESLLVSG